MPQHVPIKFISPTSCITPTLEDGDTPARRYLKMENIEVELDEELLLTAGEEPTSFADAGPHEAWPAAMLEEMKYIKENGTWELKDSPAGQRPIRLKWVFKLKKDTQWEVVKHKADLTSRWCTSKLS